MLPKPTIIELDTNKLEEILRRLEAKELDVDDYEVIEGLIGAYVYLVNMVGDKETTIRRLRQILFGAKTEKTARVIAGLSAEAEITAKSTPDNLQGVVTEAAGGVSTENDSQASVETRRGPPGHGRNGADAYTSAEKVEVPHESLQPGDSCPECEDGTLYDTGRPGVVVRLVGQAPVTATVYRLQKLRCGLCGVVFTAKPPAGVNAEEKYDATVGSILALLKYGAGMPFNRNEGVQKNLGVPLPASTQWEIVEGKAERVEPVFEELTRQAAQGNVVRNDDTGVKILEVMQERAERVAVAEAPTAERTGTFTTCILATTDEHKIALFISGCQHAGENLKDVLARRAAELPPPIQMCDALSRNVPGEFRTILGNCLAHGRRQFVDVAECFPAECQHVLESFSVVYHNDALARERNLSPEERLLFHQAESGPVMEDLHAWLVRQLDEHRVEPNSGLGKAIAYLLRHWEKLTLFLRVAGAPLDNNLCEQALKRAILHRKNALFYKTRHGAHVGDIFMSLIYTCELCGANPFDYLTELDWHADEARVNPQDWLPWNYRETLERLEHAQTLSEEDCQED